MFIWDIENAYLQKIREIDKHVCPSFFLPASDVQANCDDVQAFATFGKLVLDCESVETRSCQANYFGKTKYISDTLDFLGSCWRAENIKT